MHMDAHGRRTDANGCLINAWGVQQAQQSSMQASKAKHREPGTASKAQPSKQARKEAKRSKPSERKDNKLRTASKAHAAAVMSFNV